MSEKRQKEMSFAFKSEGKTRINLELFPSTKWVDQPRSGEQYFRVRINGKWFCRPNEQYSFLTFEEIFKIFKAESSPFFGSCEEGIFFSTPPKIESGTPVKIPIGKGSDGTVLYELTRAATDPIQGIDGRWYVGAIAIGKGTVMFAVENLIF
jgi:hypothetical protein